MMRIIHYPHVCQRDEVSRLARSNQSRQNDGEASFRAVLIATAPASPRSPYRQCGSLEKWGSTVSSCLPSIIARFIVPNHPRQRYHPSRRTRWRNVPM